MRRTWLSFRILLGAILMIAPCAAEPQMIEQQWKAEGLSGTFAHWGDVATGPAVLIIAGSGPTDRDGNGPGLATNTYKLLAEGLARAGIASLRYDKRGIGESRAKGSREEDLRFGDFVNDAATMARSLVTRRDVSGVVFAGHSEGALVAILAAAEMHVAGLVLLAPPGRSLAVILRDQIKAVLPESLRDEAFRILEVLAAGQRVGDVTPALAPLFRPSIQPFLISVLSIDPAAELAKSKVPVLVVHAARDLQIGADDLTALRRARPDARVVVLPAANHVLKTAPTDRAGNIATYNDPGRPLDSEIMAPLANFVRDVAR